MVDPLTKLAADWCFSNIAIEDRRFFADQVKSLAGLLRAERNRIIDAARAQGLPGLELLAAHVHHGDAFCSRCLHAGGCQCGEIG